MLTKEERSAITERIKSVGYVDEKTFYESIVGKCVPSTTSYTEDLKTIFRVVLDLCDTSNMLELPVDKDSEVIHIGDTVYDEDTKYSVIGYDISEGEFNIVLEVSKNGVQLSEAADNLTHKEPVTAKSLAQRIRDVLRNDHSEMSPYTSRELVHIANDLERLGDNNE